jgi:hypothetical protein
MTDNKIALAAVWLVLPTFGGILAFIAIGWYGYLLLSAMTGAVAWSMLSEGRSRKSFLAGGITAATAGFLCNQFFALKNGSISGTGVVLIVLPTMAIMIFISLRIYFSEAGEKSK